MKYDIFIWIEHDEFEHDPDSWITGPDDDFIPAPFNSIMECEHYDTGITWDHAMEIADSFATCPGFMKMDIKPAT